jgi:FAD synthetase
MNSSGRPIKRVMAFGSFDILHPGHIAYLNKARGLGDSLVVVVARDSSIRKIKHREPFFAENDRLRIISSLGMVDKAVLGSKIKRQDDKYKIIAKYRPQVIVFGYDQDVDEDEMERWLKKNKIDARLVRLKIRLMPERYKSSAIRNIIQSSGLGEK